MSEALDFLDRWEADHVEAVPADQRDKEAERLAANCREDAIRAGIVIAELEQASGGDLVKSFRDALDEAAN
jgi:hypothetical protein